MPPRFLRAAIDHGTTNSTIAVMEEGGPRALKPDGNDVVMPSAVFMYSDGRTLIGVPAIRAMKRELPSRGNGHTGYKRLLGQDERFAFDAAGKVRTAPQLGAMVIAELLDAYKQDTGQDLRGCVITVPARFAPNAWKATEEAAQQAGLKVHRSLPEPVAASLAYGFKSEDERAQWLIFDLGGGTLDINLVVVRGGRPDIPETAYGGDERLGGRNFDRELMDFVLGPVKSSGSYKKQLDRYREMAPDHAPLRAVYDLEEFSERSERLEWRIAWKRLELAVEEAKIELSTKTTACVELDGPLCEDGRGRAVTVKVPLTRANYEKLIAAHVERAVNHCRVVLHKNGLTPRDIQRLVLVGGPTKTPFIQQRLQEQLGIQLDASIDPMTAVALGGAIHAATEEIPEELRADFVTVDDDFREPELKLQYEASSARPSYVMSGRVVGKRAGQEGLTVEVTRKDRNWASGKVPVQQGVFTVTLALIEADSPAQSQFSTTLFDAGGRRLASLEEPSIWYPPISGVMRTLTRSFRVGMANGSTLQLLAAGTKLPARGDSKDHLVTTVDLRKGQTQDLLRIPLFSGVESLFGLEDDEMDAAVHIGTFYVQATDDRVTMDVPRGSDVTVTVRLDEEHAIELSAYLPAIDASFKGKFLPESYEVPSSEVLQKRLGSQEWELARVSGIQARVPSKEIAEALAGIKSQELLEQTKQSLERARQGEKQYVYEGYVSLLRLSGTVNQLKKKQQPQRIRDLLERLPRMCEDSDRALVAEFKKEFEAQGPNPDQETLDRIDKELESLDWNVRRMTYWRARAVVTAGSGLRVTPEQLEAFKKADALNIEIIERGGSHTVTAEDVIELRKLIPIIMGSSPDMDQRYDAAYQQLMKDLFAETGGPESTVGQRKS